ncbi:(2Fe-2S)-binding protein [Novosphingobium resinovorum]|uniref:(2Fe-2S)-binding protein n=1 Tax=Novosphingobium TaxID=165696 RepID=UPI001B3C59FE|nr:MULTISPECIES: (2Fe-2S)-binding protein [Novosphingobium]MBF7013286.1 (2Fe-2S)-binding protein [Novosphingobium sp. HR1a]WJM25437.1 (2Fe-2S)-binding protein [Novosphingobium resinovorum]
MKRVEQGVTRPAPIAVELDGAQVMAHPGETVAVAVLSATPRFRDDRSGRARGMFCNMGTCSECTVWVARGDAPWRRLRGCLVPVEPGLRIRTERPEA